MVICLYERGAYTYDLRETQPLSLMSEEWEVKKKLKTLDACVCN